MLFGAPRSYMFKSLQESPEGLKESMLMHITSMVLLISHSSTNLQWSHDTTTAFLIVLGQEESSNRAQISNRWIDWKQCINITAMTLLFVKGQRCIDISLPDPPYQPGPPQIHRRLPLTDQVWRSSHVTREEGLPTSFRTFERSSLIICPPTPTLGFKPSANNLALATQD